VTGWTSSARAEGNGGQAVPTGFALTTESGGGLQEAPPTCGDGENIGSGKAALAPGDWRCARRSRRRAWRSISARDGDEERMMERL